MIKSLKEIVKQNQEHMMKIKGKKIMIEDEPWLSFPFNVTEVGGGEDRFGKFSIYRGHNGNLKVKAKLYEDFLIVECEVLKDAISIKNRLKNLNIFFNFELSKKILAYSYGIDNNREEYWPEAFILNSNQKIKHSLMPLILFDGKKALIISSFSHYFISSINLISKGFRIGMRSNKIKANEKFSILFVYGNDIKNVMKKWGELFLQKRKNSESIVLSKLGYWNCFGAYYSEPFHKFDEKEISKSLDIAASRRTLIGYIGLDLWYHFKRIGLALDFEEDRKKYPKGLKYLYEKYGIPFFLHLSAFDCSNYYKSYKFYKSKISSCPKDNKIYQYLEKKIRPFSIGIWHDWLRTQQRLVKELNQDEEACENWFYGICDAFKEESLMMCMPTTGFYLASAKARNVIATRTYTDYLFKQESQLKRLPKLETPATRKKHFSPIKPSKYVWNNVMLSILANSLGLVPYYDVFLTNKREDKEGFYEKDPEREALLRALSNGIIGIGDRMDKVNKRIIGKICYSNGFLTKCKGGIEFAEKSLGKRIFWIYNKSEFGDLKYYYLAIFDLSELFNEDTENLKISKEDFLIYDYLNRKVVYELKGSKIKKELKKKDISIMLFLL
jgi:hypothetical protein